MRERIRDQGGQALILAITVLAATSFIAAGMLIAAWDATEAASLARARAQTLQAAASASELHMAVLSRTLKDRLPQNILDQGCQRQDSGTLIVFCTVPGNDTAGTSGIRRDRIQQLAAQSAQGWNELQAAFVDALGQVMPLAPEQDRFRSPAVWGFAGLAMSSASPSTIPDTAWMSYGIITPVPNRPIVFIPFALMATIPFEIRTYGWAARLSPAARPGALPVRAQATTYATAGTVTLVYPNCPPSWPNALDQICAYPQSAQVDIPEGSVLFGDPSVRWPADWP